MNKSNFMRNMRAFQSKGYSKSVAFAKTKSLAHAINSGRKRNKVSQSRSPKIEPHQYIQNYNKIHHKPANYHHSDEKVFTILRKAGYSVEDSRSYMDYNAQPD